MFIWIVLLAFGVPLVIFLMQVRAKDHARQKRLDEIQDRLQEKQRARIAEKRAKIEAKHVAK